MTYVMPTMDWAPFRLAPAGAHADAPRSINSPDGVADRLRAAAFAEIQAFHAFNWAASRFDDAPESLRQAWRSLATAEERHMNWLLNRLRDLGVDVALRVVSDHLWLSFQSCKTARDFAIFMANAEERGRKAGVRFHEQMTSQDPISAEIFRKIAEEEIEHIALAAKYFPEAPLGENP